MNSLVAWIESHRMSVELIKWIILILGAWLLGIFRIIRKYSQRPSLSLFESDGFCFIEDYQKEGIPAKKAAFIVNPCIKNPSDYADEIDYITIGYKCKNKKMSLRQNLLPISFPAPPRCQFGSSLKYLPVYLTNFKEHAGVDSIIQARRKKSGYVLFAAKTYGDWAADHDEYIDILLEVFLVSGGAIKCKDKLKVISSKEVLENFCPGIYEVITVEVNLSKM